MTPGTESAVADAVTAVMSWNWLLEPYGPSAPEWCLRLARRFPRLALALVRPVERACSWVVSRD